VGGLQWIRHSVVVHGVPEDTYWTDRRLSLANGYSESRNGQQQQREVTSSQLQLRNSDISTSLPDTSFPCAYLSTRLIWTDEE
jgi:hypothetical protein